VHTGISAVLFIRSSFYPEREAVSRIVPGRYGICLARGIVNQVNDKDEIARDILILGAEGLLGHALQLVLPHAIALGKEFDITDRERVDRIIEKIQPAIIFNAAAFTDAVACEDHPDRAFLVNGHAPGYLAAASRKVDAVLVHYSCADVFDGSENGYEEVAIPSPLGTYGASKALGEIRVAEEMEDYRIIRSSWLFGPFGRNIVDSYLAPPLGREITAPDDYFGSPTFSIDLALGSTGIILADPGIYHLTNEGVCSLYELAREVAPYATFGNELPKKAEYPQHAVLINTKTDPLRHWREALAAYLAAKEAQDQFVLGT
jgi:dTDP-4-dehydrorhamnose reductase